VDSIPVELRERAQWVVWRIEIRDGRPTKVPYSPRGGPGKSDDPQTWADFATALAAFQNGGLDGIGYMFTTDDPYCGIDLDNCRDADTGMIEPWAHEIIDQCASYSEVSPSKTGVKIFGRGKLASTSGKRHELGDGKRIELYDHGRYFTVTAQILPGAPSSIEDCQPAIDSIWQRYFDKPKPSQEGGHEPPRSSGMNALDRARKYISQMPSAISGQAGHNATYAVACELFR
jgi:primase-polymerase (primpol)-like protein